MINLYEVSNALTMIPGGIISIHMSNQFFKIAKEKNNIKCFEYSTAIASYSIVCVFSMIYHFACAIKPENKLLLHFDYYAQQICGLLHIIAWNTHKSTSHHITLYIIMMIIGKVLTDEKNMLLYQCILASITLKKYVINPWWVMTLVTRLASYRYKTKSIYHSLFHVATTFAFQTIWNSWMRANI